MNPTHCYEEGQLEKQWYDAVRNGKMEEIKKMVAEERRGGTFSVHNGAWAIRRDQVIRGYDFARLKERHAVNHQIRDEWRCIAEIIRDGTSSGVEKISIPTQPFIPLADREPGGSFRVQFRGFDISAYMFEPAYLPSYIETTVNIGTNDRIRLQKVWIERDEFDAFAFGGGNRKAFYNMIVNGENREAIAAAVAREAARSVTSFSGHQLPWLRDLLIINPQRFPNIEPLQGGIRLREGDEEYDIYFDDNGRNLSCRNGRNLGDIVTELPDALHNRLQEAISSLRASYGRGSYSPEVFSDVHTYLTTDNVTRGSQFDNILASSMPNEIWLNGSQGAFRLRRNVLNQIEIFHHGLIVEDLPDEYARILYLARLAAQYETFGDSRLTLSSIRYPENRRVIEEQRQRAAAARNHLAAARNHLGGTIYLTTSRDKLQSNPMGELHNFYGMVEDNRHANHLRVTFEGEEGIDAGGLSREFMTEAFNGVQRLFLAERSVKLDDKSSLVLPKTTKDYVTIQEMRVYLSIGAAMMFCYQNQQLKMVTNQIFDPVLFDVIFRLSEEEIDQPLSEKTKSKMRWLLAQAHEHTHGLNAMAMGSLLDQNEMSEGLKSELHALYSIDPITDENDNEIPLDLSNPEHIKYMKNILVFDSYDPLLQPIQMIAKGMKSAFRGAWDDNQIDFQEFDGVVQGMIDPDQIVQSIFTTEVSPIIARKIEWLKEWVLQKATSAEIKAFLKFVTGSQGLPVNNARIIIAGKGNRELPTSHTCGNQLDICNLEETKEQFISSLKMAIMEGTGSFGFY